MKKQLLALSLLAIPGLMAQDAPTNNDNGYYQNGYCGTCCCTPCCCKPCCVPQPKQCINCECYVPSYYDLQCDWGFYASVDFLYWYAKETNLSYAAETVGAKFIPESHTTVVPTNIYIVSTKYKDLEAKWDPGVRVGLGWNTDCDGWDAYLNWTWFHNKKHKSTSLDAHANNEYLATHEGDALLNDPWVDPAVFNGFEECFCSLAPFFDTVNARWSITFNEIDLEFGRKYWLSRCFAMRTYTGLRGAWTATRFKVTADHSAGTAESGGKNLEIHAKDKFKNKLWGVGLLGGVQPEFHFWCNFILFGNFEGSLIWGDFRSTKNSRYSSSVDFSTGSNILTLPVHTHREFAKMSAIIDLALGLRWEEQWCCYRYMTALDIGWEHHIWINHGTYIKNTAPGNYEDGAVHFTGSVAEETKDLGFGGLVIRLRLDF